MLCIAGLLMALAAPVAGVSPAAFDTAGMIRGEQALRAYAQGRLLEDQGQLRDALGAYVRALGLDHTAMPVARHIAETLYRLGDPSSAIDYADKALALAPNDPGSLWVKGGALMDMGRYPEALDVMVACVDADSSRIEYAQSLARVGESLDRPDVVARAYGIAVQLDEDDGENWFQLAAAQVRLGRFQAAERSLDRVAELAPSRPGQIFLRGFVDEQLGHADQAIARYRAHLEVHSGDQLTRQRLVTLLAREERWADALAEARLVAKAKPRDWDAVAAVAELALRAKRTPEAEASIRTLTSLAGDDLEATGRLATLLVRAGRKAEGSRLADTWASRHAPDPAGVLLSARIRMFAGDEEAALPFARRALAGQPDSLFPRLMVARIHTNAHRYEEAERVLSEGLAQGADSVALMLELGGVRELRGDLPGAETVVRQALAQEPQNPRAQNSLGYLLADQNRELPVAERLVRDALRQEPNNGAYIDSMGWIFYRLGRLLEAREQLERAVALTNGDPVVREHLGDVYRDLKLLAEAREQYQQGLARDSGNVRLKAKLAALRP